MRTQRETHWMLPPCKDGWKHNISTRRSPRYGIKAIIDMSYSNEQFRILHPSFWRCKMQKQDWELLRGSCKPSWTSLPHNSQSLTEWRKNSILPYKRNRRSKTRPNTQETEWRQLILSSRVWRLRKCDGPNKPTKLTRLSNKQSEIPQLLALSFRIAVPSIWSSVSVCWRISTTTARILVCQFLRVSAVWLYLVLYYLWHGRYPHQHREVYGWGRHCRRVELAIIAYGYFVHPERSRYYYR